MHKLATYTVPVPLKGLINQTHEVHNLYTRNRDNFVINYFRNHTVQNSFLVQGPKMWNPLGQIIKHLGYKQFSQQLKSSIIESY